MFVIFSFEALTEMERPTEPSYSSDLKEWINQIIKEEGLLSLSKATVEPIKDRKKTDILIYDHEHNPVLLIEVKRPDVMPSDPSIVRQALEYVLSYKSRGLKNYSTHNVNLLVLWDLDGKKIDEFSMTYARTLEEYPRKMDEIKENMRKFLKWYVRFLRGEPPRAIDEGIIEVLNQYITGIISTTSLIEELVNLYVTDNEFRRHFKLWLADNSWADPKGDKILLENYCTTLAKQYLYIFTNKVLFYNVLKQRFQLPDFTLPTGRLIWKSFYAQLQTYFNLAIELAGNYETVFQTNFVDRVPVPEDTINEIRKMILYLNTLDYSELGYDVIGKVFEKLIPEDERHTLGQYFTRSDIVDLILGFCVKNPSSIILDPGCGSGTFLVRGYYRLKYLQGKKKHLDLLDQLWGVDVAKFPAHLSIINLASRELAEQENYPNVIYGDFFDLSHPKIPVRIGVHATLDYWLDQSTKNQRVRIPTLSGKVIEKTLPSMDAVVGNPPYTRQEEMLEEVFGIDYKEKLSNVVKADFPEIDISQRASIYAYFFAHGLNFLSGDGKRLGFVSLRSWLDVDYGQELKKLFINNCKILAIVESKEQRWFPEAQMLPCFSILELCNKKSERNENFVKFVQLKSPLSSFVPPISNSRDMVEEIYRWERVDEFVKRVENIENIGEINEVEFFGKNVYLYEDNSMRVVMIKQKHLVGDRKWGKYLTAPSIFFKIIDSGKKLLVPLVKHANIKAGIKSGANEFFYFPNKYFKIKEKHPTHIVIVDKATEKLSFSIETEYLRPIVIKIRPHRSIRISKHDGYCLVVNEMKRELEKNGKKVLSYIEFGEQPRNGRNPYSERPTCQSRISKNREWYSIKDRESAPILCPEIHWNTHRIFYNAPEVKDAYLDRQFVANYILYEIIPKNKENSKLMCALLNSTLSMLLTEFAGRYIENRDRTISNETRVSDLRNLSIINPDLLKKETIQRIVEIFERMSTRKIRPTWEEVQMDDRKELDKIIFGEVFGLSTTDIQEIYSSLSSLVRARIERFIEP